MPSMTNPTLRDKREGGIQTSVPSSPTLEPVTSGAPRISDPSGRPEWIPVPWYPSPCSPASPTS